MLDVTHHKRGLFPQEKRDWLLEQLEDGEAEILYPNGPDQSILNYMTMRSGVSTYNFALNLPPEKRTGCCVTSPHFQQRDNLLYDKGTRLTYLHYIGVSSRLFTSSLCRRKSGFSLSRYLLALSLFT